MVRGPVDSWALRRLASWRRVDDGLVLLVVVVMIVDFGGWGGEGGLIGGPGKVGKLGGGAGLRGGGIILGACERGCGRGGVG